MARWKNLFRILGKGKQHGLGRYTNENSVEMFGIWLNGKRNRWLDEITINSLKEKNDEYYRQIIEFDPNKYLMNNTQDKIMMN